MQTWIALLRGINVGGNNVLQMKDLRALLEELNLQNVRTYIQSGNCIFACEGENAATLSSLIAEGIENRFSFRPKILVMTKEDLDAAIAANPYPEGMENPKSVHLFFLVDPANEADLKALEAIRLPDERFFLSAKVFYLYAPEGIARSKLAAQAEKYLVVPATARNLRSAIKIAELAA